MRAHAQNCVMRMQCYRHAHHPTAACKLNVQPRRARLCVPRAPCTHIGMWHAGAVATHGICTSHEHTGTGVRVGLAGRSHDSHGLGVPVRAGLGRPHHTLCHRRALPTGAPMAAHPGQGGPEPGHTLAHCARGAVGHALPTRMCALGHRTTKLHHKNGRPQHECADASMRAPHPSVLHRHNRL